MESLPEEEFKQSVTELIQQFTGECPKQVRFANLFHVLHWWQLWYNFFLYYQKICLRQGCLDGQKSFWKAFIFMSFHVNHDCFSGNPAIIPKRILRTRWFNDPWTYGSYSNPAVGWSLQDLKNLREPLPLKESKSQVPTFIEFHREYWNTLFHE